MLFASILQSKGIFIHDILYKLTLLPQIKRAVFDNGIFDLVI